MKICVLLGVLCVAVGAIELTSDREETAVKISNASEPIEQNGNVMMSETTMKIGDVTTSGKIGGDESINHSGEIANELSLPDPSVNDTKNFTVIPVTDLKISKANEKPKNIILVMVEGDESENSWEKLRGNYSFTVEGLIQSCKKEKKTNNTSTVITTHDKICDCNKLLKYNIRELIEYARAIKGMNTATLSEDNFTLPTVADFDNLPHESISIGNIDDVADTSAILELPDQLTNESRHIENHSAPKHFSTLTSTKTSTANTAHIPIKHKNKNNKDYVWDFFDMMTKIRLDFFKNLFDSLHKSPIFNNSQKLNIRKPSLVFPIQQSPTLIELISNTFMKFQSIPNDKGFLMIIVAPHSELSAIYQAIQNQSSTKVDLVIMLGLEHTHDKKTVSYVANGPGSNYLSNLQTIYELPLKIKLILDHCQGICENKELSTSTLLSTESFVAKKRVARSEDEDTNPEEEKTEKESTENESGNEDADVSNREDDSNEKIGSNMSSGFSYHFQKNYKNVSLSIILSIITAFLCHT